MSGWDIYGVLWLSRGEAVLQEWTEALWLFLEGDFVVVRGRRGFAWTGTVWSARERDGKVAHEM